MLLLLALSASWGQTFPAQTVTTLSGRTLVIPADLKVPHPVVLLAFARHHQRDFDAWRPFLTALSAKGVDWVEVPYIDVPGFLKPVIGGAMKRSVTDPIAVAHLAPHFVSGTSVRQACAIETEAHMVLLLLRQDGTIRFRWQGGPGESGLRALTAALDAP